MSSGERIGTASGGSVAKVGRRRLPAAVSRFRFGVSRMRARWLTPSPEKVKACTMPSPSNQWP